MKLCWNASSEIIIRTILDCGADVQVVLQGLLEVNKIPGVVRSHACGIATFEGQLSNRNAVRTYTHSWTLRVGAHHKRETFEYYS